MEMDKRMVHVSWDGEETYLGTVDELCGEETDTRDPEALLAIFFQDIISSLAFATNETFPDTIKITIR